MKTFSAYINEGNKESKYFEQKKEAVMEFQKLLKKDGWEIDEQQNASAVGGGTLYNSYWKNKNNKALITETFYSYNDYNVAFSSQDNYNYFSESTHKNDKFDFSDIKKLYERLLKVLKKEK